MPDGSFFLRYISDAYRFLSDEDQQFLAEFWTALIQLAGNVEQKLLEANLARYLSEMLTFSVDRWMRYSFGVSTVSTAVETETVTFSLATPVSLAHGTLMSFGLLVYRESGGKQYTYGVDYTVDFASGVVTRPANSSIQVGSPTKIRYTYVTTAEKVAGFPYVMAVDSNIVSIPVLQDTITVTAATTLLYENVDYVVGSGYLSFAEQPGPHLWAERTFIDDESPYRRFGVLIDYYLTNSPQYVQALRGLYYAYFKGSQVETIENAVRLMLGLPSAFRDGTVVHVVETTTYVQIDTIQKPYTITTTGAAPITDLRAKALVRVVGIGGYARPLRVRSVSGNTITLYEDAFDNYDSAAPPAGIVPADVQLYIPRQVGYLGDDNVVRYEEVYPDLTILVAAGDEVERYQPFTSGTQVIDKLVNPDFVIDEVGRVGIQRFLTDAATTGPGPTTDESIALQTLSSHLWVMQIHGAVFNAVIGLSDVVTFLEKIKPTYTEYIFQILERFDEPIAIEESEEKELIVDLTYTVNSNVPNVELFDIQMQLASFIQATRIVTVLAPHDLTVFAAVGETITITGLGADDGEYIIDAVLSATTMRVGAPPSADHPAPPAAARVYVRGTDDEYSAAGSYPYLGVGAGHPYMNEDASASVAFRAELDEIRLVAGPTYFLDALGSHFTMWQLDVGVDKVTVAGTAAGAQDGDYTVAEVVDDDTLRVVEAVVNEGPGIGGTISISKTLQL